MLFAILLLMSAPPPPTNEELYSAIWADLFANALIGNYNPAAGGKWYFGHEKDRPPTLRIVDLACHPKGKRRACTLDLERTRHPESTTEKELLEAGRLTCTVEFQYVRDGAEMVWNVARLPPPQGESHTQTLLQCRPASSKP